MRGVRIITAVLLLGFLVPAAVFSDGITIKLASVAPEASPWGAALNKFAADWSRISNGRVTVKIYHNGIAGSEQDIIRKARIGQVQAIVLTSFGLSEIDPDFIGISLPALVRNDRELSYVLNKMKPTFEGMLKNSGMKPLAWSKAGWVKFFSKQQITYPADLKKLKLAVGGEDDNLIQVWKIMGYNVIPVSIPQILSSLNSGLIDALYASPLAVGGFQWFGLAKHMMDLNMSPFVGAVLITDKAWKQIPEDLKPALLGAVNDLEGGIDKELEKLENDAIATMVKYGLVIHQLPEDGKDAWFKEFDGAYKYLVPGVISKDMYDKLKAAVAESRK